jgi:two-component system, OmpR family, KDP operon response regulator KdpE
MKTCVPDLGTIPTTGRNRPRVLVIDTDPGIRRLLHSILLSSAYEPIEGPSVDEGRAKVGARHLDVILLGAEMAAQLEVIRQMTADFDAPVIILSTRKDLMTAALDAGADDYLEKPLVMEEVLARIRLALRHAAELTPGQTSLRIGALCIDLERRLVTRDGLPLRLTRREYELLSYLARHVGIALTHQQILRSIWGTHEPESTDIVREYIWLLRQKVEPNPAQPQYILTESTGGYRLWAGQDEKNSKQ